MKRRETQTNKCKIKDKINEGRRRRDLFLILQVVAHCPLNLNLNQRLLMQQKLKLKLPSYQARNLPSLIKTKQSTEESLLSDSSGSRIEQRVRKEPQGCCSSTVFSEKAKKNRRWRTDRCFHDLTDSDTNSNQITDEVLKEKEVEKKALMKRRAFSKGRNSDKRPNSLSLQANTWSGSESGHRKPKRSVPDNKKVMSEKFSKFSSSEKGSLSLEKISSKSDLESSDINDDDTRGESFPYGERISPIGASHSEGNASFTKSSLFHRDHDVFASDMEKIYKF
ncbi:hypothetical protein Avbf_04704 [Armadillidium vulgare]|nr:hypothetical protein Avbf_04704 [Armadillidium vulgare]